MLLLSLILAWLGYFALNEEWVTISEERMVFHQLCGNKIPPLYFGAA